MFILLIVVVIIVLAIYNINSNAKKIATLKRYYEQSLRSTDKRVALDAGRSYYSALKKNKTLSIYDEQAITNDLSTMATI